MHLKHKIQFPYKYKIQKCFKGQFLEFLAKNDQLVPWLLKFESYHNW